MKNLELNQMELVEGGTTNRDCLLAGGSIAALFAFGVAGIVGAIGIFAMSGDCFSN